MVDQVLFKVSSAEEWQAAQSAGQYMGSADDRRDGFIHLSTRSQLPRTLRKFFAGRTDLVLLTVAARSLGDTLKWEPAGDGDLFPHIYGVLPLSAVTASHPLPLDDSANHTLPPEAR